MTWARMNFLPFPMLRDNFLLFSGFQNDKKKKKKKKKKKLTSLFKKLTDWEIYFFFNRETK